MNAPVILELLPRASQRFSLLPDSILRKFQPDSSYFRNSGRKANVALGREQRKTSGRESRLNATKTKRRKSQVYETAVRIPRRNDGQKVFFNTVAECRLGYVSVTYSE